MYICTISFFFSSRRRHTRCYRDWSSDVCSSDLFQADDADRPREPPSRDQRTRVGDTAGLAGIVHPGGQMIVDCVAKSQWLAMQTLPGHLESVAVKRGAPPCVRALVAAA